MSNVFLRLRNASLVSAVALALGACHPPGKSVEVNIAAINDFHGNLTATPFTYADASAPGGKVTLKAGGINALSGVIGSAIKAPTLSTPSSRIFSSSWLAERSGSGMLLMIHSRMRKIDNKKNKHRR